MTNITELKSIQDFANETPVAYYADKIKAEMKTATGAWRAVAELFAAAANEFSTDSDKFKSLMKVTNFSRSKVYKLIATATDERLKMYEDKLQTVIAWTVMYEITTLSNDEFQEFIASVDSDTVITIKEVNAARVKETLPPEPYKTVFSIQIDVNAIKAKLFSGVDYQELRDAIDTIQNTMNYVQVVRTSLIENDAARFADEFEREYDKLVRKLWDDEKKALIASDASTKEDIAKNQDQIQSLFSERRYKEVFSLIGSDALDQEALAKIAQNIVINKREQKFVPLASAYNAFANTEIRVAA